MIESLTHQMQRAEVEQDAAAGRCLPCPSCGGMGFHGGRYSYRSEDVCAKCGRIGFLQLDATKPTEARPGSLQKIGILARRYDLGYPNLHFDGDVRNVRNAKEIEVRGDEPEWALPQNTAGRETHYQSAEERDEKFARGHY